MKQDRDKAEQASTPGSDFATLIASKPRREKKSTAFATATSLLSHAFLVTVAVWLTAGSPPVVDKEGPKEVFVVIPLLDEFVPPPPPPPSEPEQAPPNALPEVPGFMTLQPPIIILDKIPPPDPGRIVNPALYTARGVESNSATGNAVRTVTEGNPGIPGTFVPMTQRPALLNMAEVERALQRLYPPMLRDAGIGGQTVMWFLIDEQGTVAKSQVFTPSGYPPFDSAAASIARVMRFSPAKNHDKLVRVWVQLPITFTARQPDK